MQEPPAGLAACSALFAWYQVPGTDLVRLTAAARVAGHRRDAIAAACGNGPGKDVPAVIRQQSWISPGTGPGPLFSAAQRAARTPDGRDSGCYPSLTWPWAGCGQQVTGRAPAGRPVHAGLGHAAGCAGLAGGGAAGEVLRRDWLPRLILHSEDPAGPVQRHWLAGRITGDCPRCGWHGYSGRYLAAVGGQVAAVCDNRCAGLDPAITVPVKFFPAALSGRAGPFAVIRRRDRSDRDYPGSGRFPETGQQVIWRLCWEHTSKLAEEAHGGADGDIAEISRAGAGQIMAGLAAANWPPGAARLPWVAALPAVTPPGTHPVAGQAPGRGTEARVSGFYWERHPDGPFATLIAVAAAYCSPDAYDGAYDDLISRARAPGPGDEEIRVFTAELRQALADPGLLPRGELSAAAEYDEGSGEAFLRRLRRDLSGGPDE